MIINAKNVKNCIMGPRFNTLSGKGAESFPNRKVSVGYRVEIPVTAELQFQVVQIQNQGIYIKYIGEGQKEGSVSILWHEFPSFSPFLHAYGSREQPKQRVHASGENSIEHQSQQGLQRSYSPNTSETSSDLTEPPNLVLLTIPLAMALMRFYWEDLKVRELWPNSRPGPKSSDDGSMLMNTH